MEGRNDMKKTFIDLEKARELIKEYPTPFHLYDETGIVENAKRLQKAFSWNKNFKEYFAVKATPNPYILNILKELGCGVDCSSYTELLMAKECGFSGGDIMFSSNVTPKQDYELANELGAYINFDDIGHLVFFEAIASFPKTVCLRFNPGGIFEVSNGIMDNPGDAKYGMTYEQMVESVKYLQQKGVEHFGIHAFLVSNALADDYYPELARLLFNVAVKIKNETGAHFSFINLSGGIGIPYRPDDKPCDIAHIGQKVKEAYGEVLVPNNMGDVAIFTELGRYMLGPYGCLVSTVLHQKHIYKDYVGLDACAANLMRPGVYGAYHHITVLGKEDAPHDHKYDVTGGLCENNDKFAVDRMLPKIENGDIVVIHDSGAHGFSMGYNYNGKLRSAEVLLQKDGSPKLIRRAETPDDYFATLKIGDYFE